MAECPNGHYPVTVRYEANGWRRWCGECGALMTETKAPRARPVLVVLKLTGAVVVAISLVASALVGATWIVYLLSLAGP